MVKSSSSVEGAYAHGERTSQTDDQRIRDVTPLQRLAEPHEIAHAVLFLASPAAAMVTGHVLAVDGGYLAQ